MFCLINKWLLIVSFNYFQDVHIHKQYLESGSTSETRRQVKPNVVDANGSTAILWATINKLKTVIILMMRTFGLTFESASAPIKFAVSFVFGK